MFIMKKKHIEKLTFISVIFSIYGEMCVVFAVRSGRTITRLCMHGIKWHQKVQHNNNNNNNNNVQFLYSAYYKYIL